MVFTNGMPIETAATSSSRSAIQARPRRESRRRYATITVNIAIANISQYQGLRLSRPNLPIPGKYGRSSAEMPRLPAVSVCPLHRWIPEPLTTSVPMISPKASVTIAM